MGNPFFQDVNPPVAPDPVTPHAAPGDPAGWAKVTPPGPGTAPYDISAPQAIAGITAAVTAAMDLSGGAEGSGPGAGIPDRFSPRQQEAKALLESPQGAPAMNVFAGFPDYENQDLRPPGDLQTPIQGESGAYPASSTYQPGLTQFMSGLGAGVEGVPPEGGSMDSPGGNYPGTTQPGVPTYGTS